MTILHGGYKTCLGTAAEVDRKEHAYALVHADPDGKEIAITACVPSPIVWSKLVEMMLCKYGEYMMHKSNNALQLPPNGLTSHEQEVVVGAASWLIGFMAFANQETKETLAAVLATSMDKLLSTNFDEIKAELDAARQQKEQEQQQ